MLFAGLLVLVLPLALADYPCVCTHHVSTRIFPQPTSHAEPTDLLSASRKLSKHLDSFRETDNQSHYPSRDVCPTGLMYNNDCKPEALTVTTTPSFLAIQHYHQVGYVAKDADTFRITCPGQIDKDDLVNVVSTTSAPPGCNKLALFADIAKAMNVGARAAFACTDGVHYDADAVVTAFCGAPAPHVWRKGLKVTDNCLKLPKYSPVATFDQSARYLQSAGILLQCGVDAFYNQYRLAACHVQIGPTASIRIVSPEPKNEADDGRIGNNSSLEPSAQVASQNCTSHVDIHNVVMTSHPPASEYYFVEW